jgi:2-polyprenyl-3-methyl-5-hydroxy-6-metoxy-1,4-benzoquinol methylase
MFNGNIKLTDFMENANTYTDKLNRWSSHSRIATMLEGLPNGARVLDVGANTGILARICVERGYVIRGIEPNANWLGNARNYYKEVYEGRLEQTPDTYLEGHSAVVCGDVLEHLVHPEEQLQRLVKAQPDGCIFIISVPNVANIWVRLNILLGRFDYSERGILDRTHLHFYTRKTFISLLRDAGLEVQELHVTPIPLDLVAPFFANNRIGLGLFSLFAHLTMWWPTMFGYQWVAKAIKIRDK